MNLKLRLKGHDLKFSHTQNINTPPPPPPPKTKLPSAAYERRAPLDSSMDIEHSVYGLGKGLADWGLACWGVEEFE